MNTSQRLQEIKSLNGQIGALKSALFKIEKVDDFTQGVSIGIIVDQIDKLRDERNQLQIDQLAALGGR